MLPPLELTESECLTLQELANHHPYPDFRRRALGILALAKGHSYALVAQLLGVTPPTPYNWAKAWRTKGLMGLLGGHLGGAPAKLTTELLECAEQIAKTSPCTLAEIAHRLRELHPEAPPFSHDCLAMNLKKRGFSFKRTRLSLKKNVIHKTSMPRKPT